MNRIPSHVGFVITTITLGHNNVRVTFHLDGITQNVITVLEGSLVQLDNTVQRTDDYGSNITLLHPSPMHYQVEISIGVTLTVMVSERTLSGELRMSPEACCLGGTTWGGLAGLCQCNQRILRSPIHFDETDSDATIIYKTLIWEITDPVDVPWNNDSVEYVLPGGYAGFSLQLNNSLVYSDSVVAVVSNTITISLNVKFCGPRCGGVILAYAGTTTFMVSVQSHVTIHVDDILYSTDLQPAFGNWTQFSLLYDRPSLTLQVYLHDLSGYAAWRSIQLDVDILEPLGSLALGNWLPGPSGSSYRSLGVFQGDIDEFTLWDRYSIIVSTL